MKQFWPWLRSRPYQEIFRFHSITWFFVCILFLIFSRCTSRIKNTGVKCTFGLAISASSSSRVHSSVYSDGWRTSFCDLMFWFLVINKIKHFCVNTLCCHYGYSWIENETEAKVPFDITSKPKFPENTSNKRENIIPKRPRYFIIEGLDPPDRSLGFPMEDEI